MLSSLKRFIDIVKLLNNYYFVASFLMYYLYTTEAVALY